MTQLAASEITQQAASFLMTIPSLHHSLIKRQLSCQEMADSFLKIIKKEDKKIRAFLEVFEEEAIEEAKKVDKKIAAKKEIGLLEGIPCAIKDNLLYEGHRVSAGSKILENFIAPYTATAVKKIKDAGAIILGRTNMDEFAMGSSTENSAFGPTKNPRDLSRVPGGSSGGSAAAVAAQLCAFALGSDTGGSIRQPAAFCGVVGMKPTYGAVSRYGLIAMASSLDVIGPLANTVEDTRIVFDLSIGKDPLDATSLNLPSQKTGYRLQVTGYRPKIGIPKEYFIEGLDKEVKKKTEEGIERLKKQDAKIQEVSLPHTKYALAAYYLIMPSEVSSNLARYDGIRYSKACGERSRTIKNLEDVYLETRSEGFGDEVKRRIMLGTFALSAGYYDAYYKKAKAVQETIRQDFLKVFEKVDCLITPTTPTPAFKIGEKTQDPLTMYLSDIFTVSANLAGLPALSIPAESDKPTDLPIGLQIIGPPGGDEMVLGVGEMVMSL